MGDTGNRTTGRIRVDWIDALELATALLGYTDGDNPDSDAIEEKLYAKLGVDFEQFIGIVEALVPFTIEGYSPLTGDAYRGFVKDGAFIIKVPVER